MLAIITGADQGGTRTPVESTPGDAAGRLDPCPERPSAGSVHHIGCHALA